MLDLCNKKCESSYCKNDLISNYEHIWNKWKNRKFGQKSSKSQKKKKKAIKKNQMEILELKNIKIKNSVDEFKSRTEKTESVNLKIEQ